MLHKIKKRKEKQQKKINIKLLKACRDNDFKLVKKLIKQKADININYFNYEDGHTPLILANGHNDFKITEYLIKKNADINRKNFEGLTPLVVAIREQKYILVNYLIRNGANVNVKNDYGEYVIHEASDCCDNVILLVENGANINNINSFGKTILMEAKECNYKFTENYINRIIHFKKAFKKLTLHEPLKNYMNSYDKLMVLLFVIKYNKSIIPNDIILHNIIPHLFI